MGDRDGINLTRLGKKSNQSSRPQKARRLIFGVGGER